MKKLKYVKLFEKFKTFESIYYHGTTLPKTNTNIDEFEINTGYKNLKT